MSNSTRKDGWFKPVFDFQKQPLKCNEETINNIHAKTATATEIKSPQFCKNKNDSQKSYSQKNWMRQFDPKSVDDLAINSKKLQEVEEWITSCNRIRGSEMLLITGPVGCGKTITIQTLAKKHNIKVSEWITPLDIEFSSENGQYEYKEKQSKKFLEFILNSANFISLLDSNQNKLVLVEDFPNTFMRSPSEFADVLQNYKQRAKSPIVFICSENNTDNMNTALNLFTPALKEQFKIHTITFNSVSATGLKTALKRVAEIISKKHIDMYNSPKQDLIECIVNSSAGDVRSAVLNLHFACLKGSKQDLETGVVENVKKNAKKKKQSSSKFLSIGKDQTVSILHGIGRVLNPKVQEQSNRFTHSPCDIIEQFTSQPNSFVNFLHENYLSHFSCIEHVVRATSALSFADYLLAEWSEKMCQEYGLYTAVAGLMVANKTPVSAWNPVRGPKNMRVQYPSQQEMPSLDQQWLYKSKTLVTDFQDYSKIINNNSDSTKLY